MHLLPSLAAFQHYLTTTSDHSELFIKNITRHYEKVTAEAICAALTDPCPPSFSSSSLQNLMGFILIQVFIRLPCTYYPYNIYILVLHVLGFYMNGL